MSHDYVILMIKLELIIVNVLQFTNVAAPGGLVKTVIPVSLKPKRIRICVQCFGNHSKTTCQKSAKSTGYRVRPGEVGILQKTTLTFATTALTISRIVLESPLIIHIVRHF